MHQRNRNRGNHLGRYTTTALLALFLAIGVIYLTNSGAAPAYAFPQQGNADAVLVKADQVPTLKFDHRDVIDAQENAKANAQGNILQGGKLNGNGIAEDDEVANNDTGQLRAKGVTYDENARAGTGIEQASGGKADHPDIGIAGFGNNTLDGNALAMNADYGADAAHPQIE